MREREELRRNVSVAAELLDWRSFGENALEQASEDLTRLGRNGVRALLRDLDAEIAAKKAEPAELKSAVRGLIEQADRHDFTEPLTFTYSHTARRHASGLVTNTETLEFADSAEALKAAEKIEARLDKWAGLQEDMLEELRDRERRLAEARREMPEFVASAQSLVRHVLATLY